jgi:hypothetical protein
VHQIRRLSVVRPRAVPGKVVRRAERLVLGLSRARSRVVKETVPSAVAAARLAPTHPILFHAPSGRPTNLPNQIPGLNLQPTWGAVLDRLRKEQVGKRRPHVVVYPCAALHCLQWEGGERTGYLAESLVGQGPGSP